MLQLSKFDMELIYRYRYAVIVISLFFGLGYPACSPVEEGAVAEMDCVVDIGNSCNNNGPDDTIMTWKVGQTWAALCTQTYCETASSIFTATIAGSGSTYNSTLYLSGVSFTYSFIYSEWVCQASSACSAKNVAACNRLDIYTLPVTPTCTVSEERSDGHLTGIRITCTTIKVYPEADCLFYHYKNAVEQGDPMQQEGIGTGYSVLCSHIYLLSALGDGTHTFKVRMYPRVTGGDSLNGVVNSPVPGVVVFYLPTATTRPECNTEQINGYFKGRSATCNCSLIDEGYPPGTPQWYDENDAEILTGSDGSTTFNYNSSNPVKEYICKGKSSLGESGGSSLFPRFSFMDIDSVQVVLSSTNFCLYGNNNNKQVTVTCRVPKTSASPDLTMSYSPYDGVTFTDPQQAVEVGDYYQVQYMFAPDRSGVHQVTCRAQNSVFFDLIDMSQPSLLIVYEAPTTAPVVTILGQIYQNTDSSTLSAVLVEGFAGDIICEVTGGYPPVYETRLTCGSKVMISVNDTSTLSFQSDPVTRDMDRVNCSCVALYVSGCYDLETLVTLNIKYQPTVTLTANTTELDEGQSTTLTCQSYGNPPPSLTLTRDRTGEILSSRVPGNDRTAQFDTILTNVECLDTDIYVCTASNDVGTNTSSVQIFVSCASQLSQRTSRTPLVYITLGHSRRVNTEIYGYPEPIELIMTRLVGGTFESVPARHTVAYKDSQPPYGSVEVTLTNTTLEDYTTYKVKVINSVGFMEYNFTTNEELSESLASLSQEAINTSNLEAVVAELEYIVSTTGEDTVTSSDVEDISNIIEMATSTEDIATETAEDILTIASDVSDFPPVVIVGAQTMDNSINSLLAAVDRLGDNLDLGENETVTITSGGFGLSVWGLSTMEAFPVLGIKLISGGPENVITDGAIQSVKSEQDMTVGKTDVAVQLPQNLIESVMTNYAVRLVFNVYKDTKFYQYIDTSQKTSDSRVLDSYVIGAQILVNQTPITELGNNKVRAIFRPLNKDEQPDSIICVYWDFSANYNAGGWREDGCSYNGAYDGQYLCECDHLTNFAVLVRFRAKNQLEHKASLGYITIVGLSLSIVGLAFSMLSFLCIERLRKTLPQQVLFQLSLSLILSWIVFLAGIERTSNKDVCRAVASLLHYLILASFMWTLVNGVILYRLFVKVRNTFGPNFLLQSSVVAWATPAVIVVIICATNYKHYGSSEDFCWMDRDAFYYGFVIPVATILVINITVFIIVTVSLCRRRDMSGQSTQQANQTLVNIRASFFSFVVLGLTWVFGFLAIEEAELVFQYLFCIFVTLQGVVIAFMTLRDNKVRQYWKIQLSRILPFMLEPVTTTSSSSNIPAGSTDRYVIPHIKQRKNNESGSRDIGLEDRFDSSVTMDSPD